MGMPEEFRWFLHLAGELEFAQLPPERRSLHRGISWATALCGKELVRDKTSPFFRRSPEPSFAELMTFLRRLRWAVLWEMVSKQEQASAKADRAEVGRLILYEASLAYPATPQELAEAERLFGILGEDLGGGKDDDDDTLDEETRNRFESSFEGLLTGTEFYNWLADEEGFAKARRSDGEYVPWLRNLLFLTAAEALNVKTGIKDGLTGLEDDEIYERALRSGYGNFAVTCLFLMEQLEFDEIAALNVNDLRIDGFGGLLRVPRKVGGLMGGGRKQLVDVRITPFSRIAVEQTLEGRISGPLFVFSDGSRVPESYIGSAFIQAADPGRISGPEVSF